MDRGVGEANAPWSRNAIPNRQRRRAASELTAGRRNGEHTETMVATHTRSQRACPRQRVSTMTLLLAPRQLGSQGGSSPTLSQSDSIRDLARFMTTPCSCSSSPLASCEPPSRLAAPLLPSAEVRTMRQSVAIASPRLIGV